MGTACAARKERGDALLQQGAGREDMQITLCTELACDPMLPRKRRFAAYVAVRRHAVADFQVGQGRRVTVVMGAVVGCETLVNTEMRASGP